MRSIGVLAAGALLAGGLVGGPTAHADTDENFTTPSGNINCAIFGVSPVSPEIPACAVRHR